MSIDPKISLAVLLVESPGEYALMLGSGISRAAGIPTGWEVTVELGRRVAEATGVKGLDEDEVVAWWQESHGSELNYSEVLAELAPTPSDRRNLLAEFFAGEPTAAHRAIARLVKAGHIRVVVTTNFDELLETALRDEGVAGFQVIASPDGINGTKPLVHAKCTIIKVHGDHRDPRIRNTQDELSAYPSELAALLKEVFRDYGLIVCGWSGEFDKALVDLIRQTPSRYGMFWANRGSLGPTAELLVGERAGRPVTIEDADQFFKDLMSITESVRDAKTPDLRSTDLAVATLKRYLPRPENRIELDELVSRYVTEAIERHRDIPPARNAGGDAYLQAMNSRFEVVADVASLITAGTRWGSEEHHHLWREALNRLVNHPFRVGSRPEPDLDRLPALIVLYSAALGARSKGLSIEASLTGGVEFHSPGGLEPMPLAAAIQPWRVIRHDSLNETYRPSPKNHWHFPASHWLRASLRPALATYIPNDDEYERAFDDVEYRLALLGCTGEYDRPYRGEFVLRMDRVGDRWHSPNAASRLQGEIDAVHDDHPMLHGGHFAGDLTRLLDHKARCDGEFADVKDRIF